MYERLLVALDHSESSTRALAVAKDLAAAAGSEVWILHLREREVIAQMGNVPSESDTEAQSGVEQAVEELEEGRHQRPRGDSRSALRPCGPGHRRGREEPRRIGHRHGLAGPKRAQLACSSEASLTRCCTSQIVPFSSSADGRGSPPGERRRHGGNELDGEDRLPAGLLRRLRRARRDCVREDVPSSVATRTTPSAAESSAASAPPPTTASSSTRSARLQAPLRRRG